MVVYKILQFTALQRQVPYLVIYSSSTIVKRNGSQLRTGEHLNKSILTFWYDPLKPTGNPGSYVCPVGLWEWALFSATGRLSKILKIGRLETCFPPSSIQAYLCWHEVQDPKKKRNWSKSTEHLHINAVVFIDFFFEVLDCSFWQLLLSTYNFATLIVFHLQLPVTQPPAISVKYYSFGVTV
jgi:hypothetical protein